MKGIGMRLNLASIYELPKEIFEDLKQEVEYGGQKFKKYWADLPPGAQRFAAAQYSLICF
jgi:hypothetical protein